MPEGELRRHKERERERVIWITKVEESRRKFEKKEGRHVKEKGKRRISVAYWGCWKSRRLSDRDS